MAITTYAELKTAIANWLNRDDLTSVIPDFISLAEADMDRKVRHWRMEKRATVQLDDQYSRVPSDWLESIRFYLSGGDTYELRQTSHSDMINRRMNAANVAGRPQYFTMSDGAFEIFPTPDTAYTAELLYYGRTAALSDSNTSNWVLEYAPDAYLYGALVHSAPYLVDDQRTQIWASLYQSAIDNVNMASDKARSTTSGMRMSIRSY